MNDVSHILDPFCSSQQERSDCDKSQGVGSSPMLYLNSYLVLHMENSVMNWIHDLGLFGSLPRSVSTLSCHPERVSTALQSPHADLLSNVLLEMAPIPLMMGGNKGENEL